ncbi:MAG: redoxin domain-containing protein [Acidobacteriota bacterium]
MKTILSRLLLLCAAVWLSAAPAAAEPTTAPGPAVETPAPAAEAIHTVDLMAVRAIDTTGAVHRLGLRDGLSPVALVLLETECVISRRAIPTLNDLAQRAEAAGVQFYGLVSSPYVSLAEARTFIDDYGVRFPLLFDANGDLAQRLQPDVTPEAFVVDTDNRLVYRGRIDDTFAEVGKVVATPREPDLLRAVERVARGQAHELVTTLAVGCIYEAWDGDLPTPTFHRNVSPIIAKNCASCHQSGSVAPFVLSSYASVKRRAKMVLWSVEDGFMPPWQTKPGHGVFRSTNRVSPREIEMLRSWVAAGAPEGDAADRIVPRAADDVQAPALEPDLRAAMPEPYAVAASGEDVYRYFVLPRSALLENDQVVRGIGFRAGAPSVVHHANFFVDYSGRARAADEADPAPGFSVFGTGGFLNYFDSGFLGAWGPDGGGVWMLPDDTGIPVPAGGDLVIEIHYHPSGKAAVDQSELALYFAKEPVSRQVALVFPGTQDIRIPAGDADYVRRFWMTFPVEADIYSIAPHMHFIGTRVEVDLHRPDGTVEPLLYLDDWDFRWQGSYTFPQPKRIPAGARIDARFVFDNSADNPDNPAQPPEEMTWGWASTQEMAELYILASPVDADDMPKLQTAGLMAWFRDADPDTAEPLPGLDAADDVRALIEQHGIWSSLGQRALNQVGGTPVFADLVAAHRSAVEAAETPSAQQLSDLGNLLLLESGYASAMERRAAARLGMEAYNLLERVLGQAPAHPEALYGMAVSLRYTPARMNLHGEAMRLFETVAALDGADETLRDRARRDLRAMREAAAERDEG